MKRILLLFIFIASLCGCQPKEKTADHISFYYWKTAYALTNFEKEYLRKNKVKKIYLHCFDVTLSGGSAKPEGVLLWKEAPDTTIEYIPTVFISNEVFKVYDTTALKLLSEKVKSLCTQILASRQLSMHELQIDCDWTATSRDAYFFFLNTLHQPDLILSNTLRLYQYKYRKEAGIAPTDYASLMCYNMGTMKNAEAGNSILNTKDLTSYLQSQQPYPKPMNVALPIFRWTLLYDKQQFKGILYQKPDIENGNWKKLNEIQYTCTQSYYDFSCEREFNNNETIRIEEISREQLLKTSELIKKLVNNTKNETIYFDLDSAKIRHTLF